MSVPVALYPFCAELLPAVKFFDKLQSDYTLAKLVAPPGLGLTGKDAAYAYNHPHIGIVVTDFLDMSDDSWEVLLITRTINTVISDEKYERVMEDALRSGKRVVFCSGGNISDRMKEIVQLFPSKTCIISCATSYQEMKQTEARYEDIEVPVVLVGGVIAEADTFEVLLGFADRMRADGLYPFVLSRHPIAELFGFCYTGCVFEDAISESNKILNLNAIVRAAELSGAPDAILAEAPDATTRFVRRVPNGYGILTYMLCQAFIPDYFICCIPYEFVDGGYINTLSNHFSARLGTPIHAVHISNAIVDSADLMQSQVISCVRVDSDVTQAAIAQAISDIPLFSVVNDGPQKLYAFMREIMTHQ